MHKRFKANLTLNPRHHHKVSIILCTNKILFNTYLFICLLNYLFIYLVIYLLTYLLACLLVRLHLFTPVLEQIFISFLSTSNHFVSRQLSVHKYLSVTTVRNK